MPCGVFRWTLVYFGVYTDRVILTGLIAIAILRVLQLILLMIQTKAHPHSTTILGEPGSPKRDVL